MQINCIVSGPTMAASEPPEPPPRNPDRINASLHKLSESKNIKSLDSSVIAIKDKSINNNRPIKPLLSLDNSNNTAVLASTSAAAAAAAASAATSSNISSSSASAVSTATSAAANVVTTTGNAASISTTSSGLLYNKRVVNDLTPSGDSSSPLSSNGSNQTLTSPMTIDNQTQQQSLRLAYAASKASDSHGLQQQTQQLMLQQQNGGQRGGINAPMFGETIAHQQQQQQQQQLSNGTANNSNSIVLNNQSNSLTAAVDKRNANDVCSVVKLMNSGATYSIPTCTANTMKSLSATSLPLTSRPLPTAPTSAESRMTESTSPFLLLATNNGNVNGIANANGEINSCDGNRNDELKFNSFRSLSDSHSNSHSHSQSQSDNSVKLREENERLSAELQRLRKILEYSSDGAVGGAVELDDTVASGDGPQGVETTGAVGGMPTQQRVERLEAELRSVKNQLLTMRLERKKLRTDKSELVAQVKQLCASLQEKEQELRDFIRNYQERVRESETNQAKLSGDRDRERFQLLKQARDEAERSLALAQQLNARDMQLQRLQEQLQEARRQLSGCMSDQESLLSFAPLTPPSAASGMLNQMALAGAVGGTATVGLRSACDDSGRGNSNSLSAFSGSLSGGSGATGGDRNSCSNDSVLRNNSDRESTGGELNFSDGACDNGPSITVDPDSISLVSSQNMYQFGTPKERSPTLSPLNSAAYSRSVEQLGSPVDSDGPGAVTRKFAPKTGTLSARHGRGGTWGSISRVFARSRNKNKALSADGASEYLDYSWSPLSEETYAEKLRLLREASQLPMDRWRATQVVAWLEVALGMPQYSVRCAENVKSGKVLLELNDTELEAGLGLVHPMHRKKLRLAIEEQRRPELVRYPLIAHLGHTWVASEWLPDIGLPQYAEPFLHSLVDARMLDTLSKKELEKFLGVTRKFHQASIVHGIHVLRIAKYDRQTLAVRRVQSDSVDTDPIVWTNQRFVRWARSIDLGEYSDNLKDSGVHGGLVVLEPSFSGETMATALGIPPSKNIIRRHLCTEFDALILPARATLGQGIRSGCGIVPITGPGGLQHYATTDRRSSGSLRISAWKGSQSSLSKAFRFNAKPHRGAAGDRSSFGNSTSPTPSYSSSEGGGGIYATIGSQPQHQHQQQQQQQQQQHYHFLPPPTTAPPPVPTLAVSANYGPPGHRVSAPPVGHMDVSTDPNMLLYEQHRRVKSISDIGVSASQSGGSVGGVSLSSNSPV